MKSMRCHWVSIRKGHEAEAIGAQSRALEAIAVCELSSWALVLTRDLMKPKARKKE